MNALLRGFFFGASFGLKLVEHTQSAKSYGFLRRRRFETTYVQVSSA